MCFSTRQFAEIGILKCHITLNEAAFPSPRRILVREEKNSAIFGSQRTATLDRSLVSVEWRHWQHKWSAFSVSRLRFFFFNSTHIFFFNSTRILFYGLKSQNLISTRVCSHDICLVFFPSWTNISQILNQIFFAFDVFYNFRFTYYVFNMFFPLVWFFPQRNAILSLVLKGTRTGLLLIGSPSTCFRNFLKTEIFSSVFEEYASTSSAWNRFHPSTRKHS